MRQTTGPQSSLLGCRQVGPNHPRPLPLLLWLQLHFPLIIYGDRHFNWHEETGCIAEKGGVPYTARKKSIKIVGEGEGGGACLCVLEGVGERSGIKPLVQV